MDFFNKYIIKKRRINSTNSIIYKISIDEKSQECYFRFYDLSKNENIITNKHDSLIVDDEIFDYVQYRCL